VVSDDILAIALVPSEWEGWWPRAEPKNDEIQYEKYEERVKHTLGSRGQVIKSLHLDWTRFGLSPFSFHLSLLIASEPRLPSSALSTADLAGVVSPTWPT
jgi:hypothetical protein